jgi:DNA helicase HerA-like ATPase
MGTKGKSGGQEINPGGMTIARGTSDISLLPRMANRHGLIAGATGTGKTVTLRVLAERFSAMGVPVVLADVKGDLGTICQPGGDNRKVEERVRDLGLSPFPYAGFPVVFWDVFGEKGSSPAGRRFRDRDRCFWPES